MRLMSTLLALAAVAVLAGCQSAKPKDGKAPAETPKPVESAPKPADTPKPADAPKPVDSPKPAVPVAAAGVVKIEAEACKATDASARSYPKASGGQAVLFDKYSCKIEQTVELPAGKYQVVVVGMGEGPDNDAVDLRVKPAAAGSPGGVDERIFFEKEYKSFVEANAAPELTLPAKGAVKLSVEYNDETGVAVDFVEFRPVK